MSKLFDRYTHVTVKMRNAKDIDTIIGANPHLTPIFRTLQGEHNKRERDRYGAKLDKELGLAPLEIRYPHLWGGWIKRKKKNELRSR